jgi:restriction system protein
VAADSDSLRLAMAIPDYQTLMVPLLRFASDGEEHSLRQTIDVLAQEFKLTEAEQKQLLPSGQQSAFDNRVGWARTYLFKAGLLETPRRGFFRIAPRGIEMLKSDPARIDVALLNKYKEFREFRERRVDDGGDTTAATSEKTPQEVIEAAHANLRASLAAEILETLKGSSPHFFEQIVVDLLVAMGYGGTRRDAGAAIGRSGDGGIDGVINEDRLGLDAIYVQAKRWDTNSVGRPEVQKFAGALQGQGAHKGIFITTSTFSKEAVEYASKISNRIILIDGAKLALYMIDFNVGVTTTATFALKKVDSDYFNDQ